MIDDILIREVDFFSDARSLKPSQSEMCGAKLFKAESINCRFRTGPLLILLVKQLLAKNIRRDAVLYNLAKKMSTMKGYRPALRPLSRKPV